MNEKQSIEGERNSDLPSLWAEIAHQKAELVSIRAQVELAQRLLFEVGVEHSGMSLLHQVTQAVIQLKSGRESNIELALENNALRQEVEELRASENNAKMVAFLNQEMLSTLAEQVGCAESDISDRIAGFQQQVEELRAENERLKQLGDDKLALVGNLSIRANEAEHKLSAVQAKLQQAEASAAAMRKYLLDTADTYVAQDGSVGERGYNCWGYRSIADHLQKAAALSTNAGASLLAVVEAAEEYRQAKEYSPTLRRVLSTYDALCTALERCKEGRQDG